MKPFESVVLKWNGMFQPPAFLITRFVFQDGFRELLSLPVWWYTRGAWHVCMKTARAFRFASRYAGLGIWIKNLFVPMYGDVSFSGRLISFFVRLCIITIKSVGVVLFTLIAWLGFVVYLLVPLALVWGFLFYASVFA